MSSQGVTPAAHRGDKGQEALRIVQVAACPFPANHGTPGAIRELSLALADLGHEVHVVTYPMSEDIPVDGLHIHRVDAPGFIRSDEIRIGPTLDRPFYDLALVWKLIQVIREYDIDVIHSHNYEATIVATIAKWVTGKVMVYTGINSMADELPTYDALKPKWLFRALGWLLDRTVPRGADFLTVLSDDLSGYLQTMGVPREKLLVIPPGADLSLFDGGDGVRIRRRYDLAETVPVVIYTGALEGFQRVDLLFEAMPHVLEQHPDAVLMMAVNLDNVVLRNEYQAMAEKLGVAASTIFTDPVSLQELPDYLAAADVAVVPRPACPGFPIKLLNYMAARKAIVSAEGGAKPLCHGYNGYVAKNRDPVDLGRGISALLGDPELRAVLGERARTSLPGLYDWETLARGTTMLYERLLDDKRHPDLEGLGRFIKGSYAAVLDPASTAVPGRVDGFLQTGPVRYEEFVAGGQR